MSVSKRTFMVGAAAIGLGTAGSSSARAQGGQVIGDLAENEGLYVDLEEFKIRKGRPGGKSAQLAMLDAREVSEGAVILRSGGKLYLVDTKPKESTPQAMKDFSELDAAADALTRVALMTSRHAALPCRPASAFPMHFSRLSRPSICAIYVVLAAACMPAIGNAAPAPIRVEYVPPSSPEHRALYQALQQRRALEKLQKIFSPFRLPIELTIEIVGCEGVANAYYHRAKVRICYEYLDEIRKNIPKETTEAGITPTDAVLGQFFYVVAHEVGHAVFDLLDVPLFGRPEDAADQFAAYMMLQFGKTEARRLIGGAAYSYRDFVRAPKFAVPLEAFSNAHGAPAQRFYNLLCMAYGADPRLFADLIEKGYLPQKRAATCRGEYGEVAFAFEQLLAPHLDQEAMKQVFDRAWLPDTGAPSVHR